MSAQLCRTNEWHTISAHHVRNNELRVISVRDVVVNVTSWMMRLRGEKRVDKGLIGRWRKTELSCLRESVGRMAWSRLLGT